MAQRRRRRASRLTASCWSSPTPAVQGLLGTAHAVLLVAVQRRRDFGSSLLLERLFFVLQLAGLLDERARGAERPNQRVLDHVATDAVALPGLEPRDELHRGLTDAAELRGESVKPAPEADVLRRRVCCKSVTVSARVRPMKDFGSEEQLTLSGSGEVRETAAIRRVYEARAEACRSRQSRRFMAAAQLVVPVAQAIESDFLCPVADRAAVSDSSRGARRVAYIELRAPPTIIRAVADCDEGG